MVEWLKKEFAKINWKVSKFSKSFEELKAANLKSNEIEILNYPDVKKTGRFSIFPNFYEILQYSKLVKLKVKIFESFL